MAGDNRKLKAKSPARQIADIAAEYFRPSGVPKSYVNDAVEVHAVNLERRLTEAVDELITSRDFVIGELVKALEAITNGPCSQRCEYCGKTTRYSGKARIENHRPDCPVAIAEAALTAAGRKA